MLTAFIEDSAFDDIATFEEDFCAFIEWELNLPDGSCQVESVNVLPLARAYVDITFTITLTEEGLQETEFSSKEDIEQAWENINNEIAETLLIFIYGCSDDTACNYNNNATIDDGSCNYPEENFNCDGECLLEIDCVGECGGDALLDVCDVCNGAGPTFECFDSNDVYQGIFCSEELCNQYILDIVEP